MAKIARLAGNYWVNFDNHCLYFDGEIIAELKKRHLQVLEYLSNYPNCYKTCTDINNFLDEGCLSADTIRSYVSRLRNDYDPVIAEVVTSNNSGSGYKYLGYKIEDVDLNTEATISKRIKNKIVDVDEVASLLWKNRPFYQDNELIRCIL